MGSDLFQLKTLKTDGFCCSGGSRLLFKAQKPGLWPELGGMTCLPYP
jgi:hypothetical protein